MSNSGENAEDERRKIEDELSGPLRIASSDGKPGIQDTDPGAPSWWHGDEDAAQSSIAAMGLLRKRR